MPNNDLKNLNNNQEIKSRKFNNQNKANLSDCIDTIYKPFHGLDNGCRNKLNRAMHQFKAEDFIDTIYKPFHGLDNGCRNKLNRAMQQFKAEDLTSKDSSELNYFIGINSENFRKIFAIDPKDKSTDREILGATEEQKKDNNAPGNTFLFQCTSAICVVNSVKLR